MPYRESEDPAFNEKTIWSEGIIVSSMKKWIFNPTIKLLFIPIILGWWIFVVVGYPFYTLLAWFLEYLFKVEIIQWTWYKNDYGTPSKDMAYLFSLHKPRHIQNWIIGE